MAKQAVIITGAARRVGAAMALYFARHGYDIALHYHRSAADARKLKNQVEEIGVGCALFAHDVSDIKGIPALMKKIKKAMPHASALINNASLFERAEFMETDEALFDRQFSVNFKAPFFLTQAFANTFGKGCVVNITDSEIVHMHGSHFIYLLSKKALAEFTQMAARALGPKVRVNAVCPGIILPSNELGAAYMKKLSASLPLKKVAALQQVAAAAHWLCEDEALTGQLLFIDGGQHLL